MGIASVYYSIFGLSFLEWYNCLKVHLGNIKDSMKRFHSQTCFFQIINTEIPLLGVRLFQQSCHWILSLVSENNLQTSLPSKPDLPQVPQTSTQLLWCVHIKCILPSTLLFWYHSNPLKFNLSIMNFIFSRSIIVFSSSSPKGNSLSCTCQS